MSDDFAAPVKGIVKAFDTGVKLAKRVAKSAGSASAAQALEISESAQNLQKSLERSSEAITNVYKRYAGLCGPSFAKALVDDKLVQSQLKELRIDLIDQINEIQDFDDEPQSFDPAAFTAVQTQSEKISKECIQIFEDTRDQLAQANLKSFASEEKPSDDRAQLTSMKSASLRKPLPLPAQASPTGTAASMAIKTPTIDTSALSDPPPKPRDSWTIDSPSQFDLGAQSSISLGTSPRQPSGDISPSSKADDQLRLIPKAHVDLRLNANEDFLERRRQSRIAFQNEFRKSVVSIEEDRASTVFADGPLITSPILGSSTVASPIDGRNSRASLNGYDTLMTRQRSQGHASQATRSSRTSSMLQDYQPQDPRSHRQNSEDSVFGLRQAAPSSPPISDGRSSGSDHWGAPLATTLKLPGFGSGVEDGLEAVSNVDHENEKILVTNENRNYQTTPTASMKSIDCPMRHDSSFYKFGGFCEGARAMIRGDEGFKIVKRPSGNYSATVSARCIKCSYEVGWNAVEKDRRLDKSGIYGNSGIRWRQRFITKCHLRTNSIEEPFYACIFCIEEHKTIEEHDATVFFSVTQFFKHLAKHSRPLPRIAGINAIYGKVDPSIVDFDIHFVTLEPRPSEYGMMEIAQKVAARPSANAITTYHPKNSRSNSRDPDGNPTLHFAAGARIVGITFPENFGGAWCVGYHDGDRGSFPSAAVLLEMPAKEDVLMNMQSSLIAYAKWDFKPKDAKDGGWLKFSRGDKISSIGYTFQDQWCWSGQISKGKWGLFPMAFVENLQDGGSFGSSPGSMKSGGLKGLGKFGSISGSFPLGRKRGERSGSIKSQSSGKVPSVKTQPGLEVVVNGVMM